MQHMLHLPNRNQNEPGSPAQGTLGLCFLLMAKSDFGCRVLTNSSLKK